MLKTLITIFKIPELRRKILITLMFLAVYRVGFRVPLPIIDQGKLARWFESQQATATGRIFGYVALFSGTELGTSTIFGLGIMPYISASIIFQLLSSVVPALEKLSKEGEAGRKKINEYTRYAAVVLCMGQSAMWLRWMMSIGIVPQDYRTFGMGFMTVMTMTAGTMFLMWIGEQIDEYGIGNGISLIIMAGIIARMPAALLTVVQKATLRIGADPGQIGLGGLVVLVGLFVAVVVGVILITLGQRRIPIQSAKHVRGHRVYGGQRQYLPLRINQAGVMPVIFASSLLMFPYFIFNWVYSAWHWGWLRVVKDAFARHGYVYCLFYVGLIYFFCYFWTAITFRPKDMADNLKDYGSFIKGRRPGKPTADYLEKVMLRITYVGAGFLALVALIPTLINQAMGVGFLISSFYGGTGLLIVVSVALDMVQKVENHLLMRSYEGLT